MKNKVLLWLFPGSLFILLILSFNPWPAGHGSEIACGPTDTLLKRILGEDSIHPAKVLQQPAKYRVQVIYTQINRDSLNHPVFKEYRYRVDSQNYFYCASLVKLPCSALALEKINDLSIPGLTAETHMLTDSSGPCQKKAWRDTGSADGFPSVAQYIKRMLLISDNAAYNRIYEFTGPAYISKKLTDKGYPRSYIIQRFDPGCKTEDNTITNPIHFIAGNGSALYDQPAAIYEVPHSHPMGKPLVGRAYMDADRKKVNKPRDFSKSNYLSLPDITTMLRSIVFPNSIEENRRFHLKPENRLMMLRYLSMLPRESVSPRYNSKQYPDNYKKYLIYGDLTFMMPQDSIRVFNIVGESYGFVSDVAYICDFKNGIEFMLSAVIYANEGEIINNNKYDYKTIAMPWLSSLGKAFYNYEHARLRPYRPDLSEFRFSY